MKMLGRQDTEELTEVDFMWELEKEVLNRMRKFLCDHLEPERFFPYLQSKKYLDAESCEQIRSAGTTRNRVNKMLEIIIRSGLEPLQFLTRAIEKSGPTQKFVSKRITDEFRKVRNLPANLQILEEIRQRQHFTPTLLCTPDPPPYPGLPPNGPQHGWGLQSASMYPTPFPFSQTGTNSLEGSGKASQSPDFPMEGRHSRLSNGVQPPLPSLIPNIPKLQAQGSSLSTIPSEAPEISFMQNPSPFGTSDFPPSSTDFMVLKASEYSPDKNIPEIIADQMQEQQKISLSKMSTPDPPISLVQHIVSGQEKEFSKYDSHGTDASLSRKWVPRSSRMPSEHDASVAYIRSSPTNTSPTHLSLSIAENSSSFTSSPAKSQLGDSSSPAHEHASPRLRNLKSMLSQGGSIQPSCFTSSSFESCTTAKTSQDATEKFASASSQLRSHGSKMHSPGRQISTPTPLEPIQSMEVPSAEVSLSASGGSVSIRNPPTEHEDASITHSVLQDDENSSLEISTDSEASVEQQ